MKCLTNYEVGRWKQCFNVVFSIQNVEHNIQVFIIFSLWLYWRILREKFHPSFVLNAHVRRNHCAEVLSQPQFELIKSVLYCVSIIFIILVSQPFFPFILEHGLFVFSIIYIRFWYQIKYDFPEQTPVDSRITYNSVIYLFFFIFLGDSGQTTQSYIYLGRNVCIPIKKVRIHSPRSFVHFPI